MYLALKTNDNFGPLAGSDRRKEEKRTGNGQEDRKTGERGDWNS